jgi:hypothetical protein
MARCNTLANWHVLPASFPKLRSGPRKETLGPEIVHI